MTETTENNIKQHQPVSETEPTAVRPSLSGSFPGIVTGNGNSLYRDPLFNLEDPTLRSALPKVSHWSIAWSDLMMTMFILFLSMFVYQAAHKEFLVSDEVEVLGGETIEAIEIAGKNEASFPFAPIKPARPLISDEKVKKVEPIHLYDIDMDTPFFAEEKNGGLDRIRKSLSPAPEPKEPEDMIDVPATEPVQSTAEPDRLPPGSDESEEDRRINKIFSMSNKDIANLGLKDFASINLVPDSTMRIILTGDLLFETGKAELNYSSKASIKKIAAVIKNTPYMVNIIGHTDNIPMHSEKFTTNWELSVARASTVARFLIEEMKMNPNQFVVSGYSSYRPLKPNTNTRNRAINRRVEIIISKQLPAPVAASAKNIH